MMTNEATLLQAGALTKSFSGHAVLHVVDLRVDEGEFLSVMGPSGSGKSTLLYTISRMDSMTSGAGYRAHPRDPWSACPARAKATVIG